MARPRRGIREMTDTSPAIETRGLSKRYGRTWALVGLDLRLARGKTLVVAGRNGSGKSTLLRLLAGSLRPDQGEIRVFGEERRKGRSALVSHAAFTYDALSGLENLRIVAEFTGRPAGRDALEPLLDRVGLGKRGEDPVQTYSAGMRKRLALARALLQDAPLLLLDEPYGQLDPPGFAWIDGLVQELREEGKTVVLASHQVERVSGLCEEALLLEGGQKFWAGPATELPEAFAQLETARGKAVAG